MNPTLWLESFFLALLRASWQASVLIVLVLLLRACLRKAMPPEWRTWFWMLVLVRLALPFSFESPLSIFNYSRLQVPAALHSPTPASPGYVEPGLAAAPGIQPVDNATAGDSFRSVTAVASPPTAVPDPRKASLPPLKAVLAGIWCLGALMLLFRVFWAHHRLALRLRGSAPSTDPMLLGMLATCTRELGLRRSPLLIETDAVCSPALFGVLSPKLLLPASAAAALTRSQLRCVMLHELCHLRRRDVLLNWLATGLQILHWFNPLVWLASERYRADRELACDAKALGHLHQEETGEYGNTIIRLVEGFSARSRIAGVVGISENINHLALRLAMIGRFARRPLGLALLAVSGAVLLGLVTLTDAQAPGARPAGPAGFHLDLFLFQGCTSAPRPCPGDPPAAVKAAIEKAVPTDMDARGEPEKLKRKMEALRALTVQYPREVAVHLAYQASCRRMSIYVPDSSISEYRGMAEQHPDDALYQYLYGNAQLWSDRAKAGRALTVALQKDPTFLWPHLALARLDSIAGKSEDATGHLRTFLDKYPCNLEAYALLIRSEPAGQAALDIPKMRQLFRQNPAAQFSYYRSLWDTQFEVTPVPEYPGVRKAISADLAELRGLNRVDDPSWWSILADGYQRAWDQKGLDWARSERARQLQKTPFGFDAAYQKWMRDHPYPIGAATSDDLAARARVLLEQTSAWVREWPDDVGAWSQRFVAVANNPKATPGEVDAAIEGLLRALEKNRNVVPFAAPGRYQMVASYYTQHNVHLDLVPGLVDKMFRAAESSRGTNPNSPLALERTQWQGWYSLAEAYIGLKQFDKARATIDRMKAYLAKQGTEAGVNYQSTQVQLLMARLAEAENRKTEALSLYQSVLRERANNGGELVSLAPGSQPENPVMVRAAKLWQELNRPASAWQSFAAELQTIRSERQKKTAAKWQSAETPLPDFQLTDAQGKTWRLSDLKGKTTFIQVWAVWSSRYDDSLKPVQELYDRLKDRKDVVFLAFNADQSVEQIEGFLKERHYSFPVVPAYRYVQSISPFTGWWQSWIIDGNGTMRAQLKGNVSAADFVNDTLDQINQVSRRK
jgi:beta-lactamase regulating signal transducer with metallopeptidase domain/tetratricopeptide (TPR) repeat protein